MPKHEKKAEAPISGVSGGKEFFSPRSRKALFSPRNLIEGIIEEALPSDVLNAYVPETKGGKSVRERVTDEADSIRQKIIDYVDEETLHEILVMLEKNNSAYTPEEQRELVRKKLSELQLPKVLVGLIFEYIGVDIAVKQIQKRAQDLYNDIDLLYNTMISINGNMVNYATLLTMKGFLKAIVAGKEFEATIPKTNFISPQEPLRGISDPFLALRIICGGEFFTHPNGGKCNLPKLFQRWSGQITESNLEKLYKFYYDILNFNNEAQWLSSKHIISPKELIDSHQHLFQLERPMIEALYHYIEDLGRGAEISKFKGVEKLQQGLFIVLGEKITDVRPNGQHDYLVGFNGRNCNTVMNIYDNSKLFEAISRYIQGIQKKRLGIFAPKLTEIETERLTAARQLMVRVARGPFDSDGLHLLEEYVENLGKNTRLNDPYFKKLLQGVLASLPAPSPVESISETFAINLK